MAITQNLEYRNNSTPPPCPIHGMRGGRKTSCVAVPTTKTMTTDDLISRKHF